MTGVMLDTNAVSDFIRSPNGAVAMRVRIEQESLTISIVVAAELRYGAAKQRSPRMTADVERVLTGLGIEPLTAPVDALYGNLRARREWLGQPMAANDLFIAAHALTLGRKLVTRDKAFDPVPDLIVEDWTVFGSAA